MSMCLSIQYVRLLSVPEGDPSDVSEGVANCGLVQRCGSVL